MTNNSQIIPINNSLVTLPKEDVSVSETDLVIEATVSPDDSDLEDTISAEVVSIEASIEDFLGHSPESDFVRAINNNLAEVLSTEATEEEETMSVNAFIHDLLSHSTESDFIQAINHNLASVVDREDSGCLVSR